MTDGRRRGNAAGFTLMEMVIVIVAMLVLVSYAFMKNGSVSDFTVRAQTDTVAAQIRHAQSLAVTWDQALTLTFDQTTLKVTCTSASVTSPCNGTNPVVDPATSAGFQFSLPPGMSFSPAPLTITLDSFGRPGAGSAVSVNGTSSSMTVNVAAVTGQLSIQ